LEICFVIAFNDLALGVSTESLEITETYVVRHICNSLQQIFFIHQPTALHFFLLQEPKTAQLGSAQANKKIIHYSIASILIFSYYWMRLMNSAIIRYDITTIWPPSMSMILRSSFMNFIK